MLQSHEADENHDTRVGGRRKREQYGRTDVRNESERTSRHEQQPRVGTRNSAGSATQTRSRARQSARKRRIREHRAARSAPARVHGVGVLSGRRAGARLRAGSGVARAESRASGGGTRWQGAHGFCRYHRGAMRIVRSAMRIVSSVAGTSEKARASSRRSSGNSHPALRRGFRWTPAKPPVNRPT